MGGRGVMVDLELATTDEIVVELSKRFDALLLCTVATKPCFALWQPSRLVQQRNWAWIKLSTSFAAVG